jgi:hypothetical protein
MRQWQKRLGRVSNGTVQSYPYRYRVR